MCIAGAQEQGCSSRKGHMCDTWVPPVMYTTCSGVTGDLSVLHIFWGGQGAPHCSEPGYRCAWHQVTYSQQSDGKH
jgi:hypothetical protein